MNNLKDYYKDSLIRESRFQHLKNLAETWRQDAKEYVEVLRTFRETIVAKKTLLDVGAGTGLFVETANASGLNSMGLEPNGFAVQYARQHNIPVVQGFLGEATFDKTFDLVTMWCVLPHVDDPVATLRKAKQYLSKDGLLLLEVPDAESYPARKRTFGWPQTNLEHVFYFSRRSMSHMLSLVDMELVAVRGYSRYVEMGIKECLRRITGIGMEYQNPRNGLQPKTPCTADTVVSNIHKSGVIKNTVRRYLRRIVTLLGRDDYIICAARQRRN